MNERRPPEININAPLAVGKTWAESFEQPEENQPKCDALIAELTKLRLFVKDIAENHPIRDRSGYNVCSYCDEVWASYRGPEGHLPDCIWVRALALVG